MGAQVEVPGKFQAIGATKSTVGLRIRETGPIVIAHSGNAAPGKLGVCLAGNWGRGPIRP